MVFPPGTSSWQTSWGEDGSNYYRVLTEKLTTKMTELGCYVFENDHFLQNLRAKTSTSRAHVINRKGFSSNPCPNMCTKDAGRHIGKCWCWGLQWEVNIHLGTKNLEHGYLKIRSEHGLTGGQDYIARDIVSSLQHTHTHVHTQVRVPVGKSERHRAHITTMHSRSGAAGSLDTE